VSSPSPTFVARARQFLAEDLWTAEARPRSLASIGIRVLQLCVMIGQGFLRDQLLLRASALTYIAALTLIPLLVVVVSIMKGVGVSDNLVLWAIDNVTAASPDAAATIVGLVQDANLRTLGTVGAVLTFVTTVLALRHAEGTLNEIWGVRRGRGWLRRLADYLLVIVVVPLVTSVAFSLEASLHSGPLVEALARVPGFELLYAVGLRQLPYVLFALGFAFIYWFLPNTDVRPTSALLGGAVAAVLVVTTQRYLLGSISGAARYNALFGSFAAIPLILFWLYIALAIVLLGAEVSFAHQNLSRYRRDVQAGPAEPAEREALGLRVAAEVARRFRDRLPAASAEDLSEVLDFSVRGVREVLERLEGAGVVARLAAAERDGGYQLGRPAEDISVSEVLAALRGRRGPVPAGGATADAVERVLQDLEAHEAQVADTRKLSEVIASVPRGA